MGRQCRDEGIEGGLAPQSQLQRQAHRCGGAQSSGRGIPRRGLLQQSGTAQHHLLGPHGHRQRFDHHGAEAPAPGDQGDPGDQQDPQPHGAGPVGQMGQQLGPGGGHGIGRRGDVPAELTAGSQGVEHERGVVRLPHPLIGQQVRAAEHQHLPVGRHQITLGGVETALSFSAGAVERGGAAQALLAGDGEGACFEGEVAAALTGLDGALGAERPGRGDQRGEIGQGHEVGLDQHQLSLPLLEGPGELVQLRRGQGAGSGHQHGAVLTQGLRGVLGVPVHPHLRAQIGQHLHHGFRALRRRGIGLEGSVPVDPAGDGHRDREHDAGGHQDHQPGAAVPAPVARAARPCRIPPRRGGAGGGGCGIGGRRELGADCGAGRPRRAHGATPAN